MASATLREVDLSGARMRGVLLVNADIDGRSTGCALTALRSCR
jgi:uncharacterized protein YjbI with pentapeptide repeats